MLLNVHPNFSKNSSPTPNKVLNKQEIEVYFTDIPLSLVCNIYELSTSVDDFVA